MSLRWLLPFLVFEWVVVPFTETGNSGRMLGLSSGFRPQVHTPINCCGFAQHMMVRSICSPKYGSCTGVSSGFPAGSLPILPMPPTVRIAPPLPLSFLAVITLALTAFWSCLHYCSRLLILLLQESFPKSYRSRLPFLQVNKLHPCELTPCFSNE